MSDLRQGFSRVGVKGILIENNLEESISKKTGKPYIAGDLLIKTSKDNIVKVEMYSNKFKKDGNLSKLFTNFTTIMNSYKSVADVGEENAHHVDFNSADISASPFLGKDGSIIENYRVRGTFPNRINEAYEAKATFEMEIVVDSIFDEMDQETKTETGAKILKGYYVGYGSSIVALDFIVESPEGIQYVESQYKKGDTVKVFGNLVNREIIVKTVQEVGFGGDVVSESKKNKRKLLITRGTAPYANGKEYALEEIIEAIKLRNINLKSKVAPTQTMKKSSPDVAGGFNPSNF